MGVIEVRFSVDAETIVEESLQVEPDSIIGWFKVHDAGKTAEYGRGRDHTEAALDYLKKRLVKRQPVVTYSNRVY